MSDVIKVVVNQQRPQVVKAVNFGGEGSTSTMKTALAAAQAANAAYAQANAAYDAANTKVAKAGDTMTGALVVNDTITVSNATFFSSKSNVSTISTVDSFSTSKYRSAVYEIQITHLSEYHTITIKLLQNSSNVWLTQYGEIMTGNSLGTFDASISTGNVLMQFSPTFSNTQLYIERVGISV